MASLFSTLACLVLALTIGISSALPLRQPRQSLENIKILISRHTGSHMFIHEDGNVTADGKGLIMARFIVRPSGDKFVFQSVDYNGSFLHFAQVINVNGSSNASSINGTEINSNSTISNDTVLVLQIGALALNDSESEFIQHHQWVEEVDNIHGFRYYSVKLEDGQICYLAFENDGKPVEDPCQHKDDLSTKAQFWLYP